MKNIRLDTLEIRLQRKAIKNLYIRVTPPSGQVTVSIPMRLSEQTVRQFIIEKLPWIKAQQQKFLDGTTVPDTRFEEGETHYLWAEPYALRVFERHGKHQVLVIGDEFHFYVRAGTTTKNKALLMDSFYKACIEQQLRTLIPLWEQRMSVKVPQIRLRRMKSRWGSCRTDGQRICLNTELAKKAPESLEYVLVHEMVHLFEPSHNHRFKSLMDRFLPDWRERKQRLNSRLR